jgi:hypothetical protein
MAHLQHWIPLPYAEAILSTAQEEINRYGLPVHAHLIHRNATQACIQLHRTDDPLTIMASSPIQVIDAIEFLLSPTEIKEHYGIEVTSH